MQSIQLQGGQQALETVEDPEKHWIFFAPGKIPWKTLKLQPIPVKLCSEAYFPCINTWLCSAVTFFIPVGQWRRIYEVSGGGGMVYHVLCGRQPLFPTMEMKVQVKCRMERWMGTGRRSMHNDLFLKSIVKNPLENPLIWLEILWKALQKFSFDC